MPRGGARIRSGPPPDPNSRRSEQKARRGEEGAVILPAAGWDGKPPKWPMPKGTTRERAQWKKIWTFPQAAAWIDQEWRWQQLALYVRWSVRAEATDANASTITQVMRLADAIGLTPAGLAANGWRIEDVTGKEEAPTETPDTEGRRMRVVASNE